MFPVKLYFGKNISPSTSSRKSSLNIISNPAIGTFRDVPSSKSHHPYNIVMKFDPIYKDGDDATDAYAHCMVNFRWPK